jgi:K+-transporting ATPase KdpF subunit
MPAEHVIFAIICLIIVGYLFYVLVRPESF